MQEAYNTIEASKIESRDSTQSRTYWLLIAMIIMATLSIRFIHLDADPVPWFTEELGYRIDEGYKTLSPRNLVLFGQTHWHPEDEYRGWMRSSAMTQWPYYFAFRTFGTQLSSARMVSIVYFGVFLLAAAIFLWKRSSPQAAVLGIVMLSFDPGLFFFSRSAIFEMALTVYTYLPLLIIVYLSGILPARYKAVFPILLIVLTFPAFFFLKKSIVLYMGPILAAFVWYAFQDKRILSSRAVVYLLALAVICSIAYIYLSQMHWVQQRLNLGGLAMRPQRLFLNPIHTLSPVILLFAYTVLIELSVRKPDSIFKDPFRLSLAMIVIMTPVGLSLFSFNPARYYLPVLPAAIFLIVERFSLTLSPDPIQKINWRSWPTLFAGLVFALAAMTLWASFNYYVLENLPMNLGGAPGLSVPMLLRTYPLFLLMLAGAIYYIGTRKQHWYSWRSKILESFSTVHVLCGTVMIVVALSLPSYKTQEITDHIMRIGGSDATIGGDWIPHFAVNTSLRVLYMRPDFNSAERIEVLRPGYFFFSNSLYDQSNLKKLRTMPNIELDEPVKLGEYAGESIYLYKIRYLAESKMAERNP
jgi:hypothetical protein